MATANQIPTELIERSIGNAVQNVSRALIKQDTRLVERLDLGLDGLAHRFQLIANVGFAGELNGVVYLCMDDAYAHYAVGEILGMTPAEVIEGGNEVIRDAVGEVTNMTVGGFKNALSDLGFPCMLTLPTIIRGENLAVATLRGARRLAFRFDCAGHALYADIQLKAD